VYPYIDYRYLNISTIKEYLQMSVKEGNVYKVRVSDLILNSDSNDYITINVEEGDNNIIIDYSHLLEISDENLEKVLVNITYDNIESVISLEE
jgi:transcriptional antiterminator Rof (Rho-off)